ncbi:hypothetical protein AAC03nite_17980 [Alicyclobacillus acidoterrestris]|nr:hypothetical protein AAC03nite_17980 [Alicyclobacillus acidoterrestris]
MFDGIVNRARLRWKMVYGRDRRQVAELVSRLNQAVGSDATPELSIDEKAIVERIRAKTREHNCNNLTRTEAYLAFYRDRPEVHWALLAHMVSRNGGWSMSDVKGEWFARIAEKVEQTRFFEFLERANWLIFGDAYPQLLLYAEAVTSGRNLCHLLPALGVSRFMPPVWDWFMQTHDSSLLTHALIINEQNFIEARVVQNAKYAEKVLFTPEFQTQSMLGLNQVVFPYREEETGAIRLAGTGVAQFASLDARIATGKKLYRILFHKPALCQAIVAFATAIKHTGSRADYWPNVFTPTQRDNLLDASYQPCFIERPGAARIYSPHLAAVWPDVSHAPVEAGDWFHDMSSVIHLFTPDTTEPADFTDDYVAASQTVEHVILAKEKLEALAKPFR